MIVSFSIPGRIRGKGRPRATVRGGFARMYTDVKTKSDEAMVRHFASQAMYGLTVFKGPVELCISVYQHVPDSWSKKRKREAGYITGKPDCDNVLKLIGDSLNGIVFTDDSQVAQIKFSRRYTEASEQEHVAVQVRELSAVRAVEQQEAA